MEAKLYVIPGSHPAMAARLMLERKGIPYKRVDLIPVVSKGVLKAQRFPGVTVPALKLDGRPLLGFRVAKRHLSVFPFSAAAVDAVRDRLEGFDLSKGTIRFSAEKPLPDDAVRELVQARIVETERR